MWSSAVPIISFSLRVVSNSLSPECGYNGFQGRANEVTISLLKEYVIFAPQFMSTDFPRLVWYI